MSKMSWSIRSKEIKEIVDHLTEAENDRLLAAARRYGVWCGLTASLPVTVAIVFPSFLTLLLGALLVTVHVIRIPFVFRSQKKFLCSTQLAIQHGYSFENLKLFDFQRAKT